MHKILISISLLLLSTISMAQINNRTRVGSCASYGKRSRLYITPYIGGGGAFYKYNLNNTVMSPDSLFFKEEQGRLYSPLAGINLMYNLGKTNLGGGAEIQNLSGNTNNGLTETKRNILFYKFYGRLEYAFYKDAFFDFGINLDGGFFFPQNIPGKSAQMGVYAKAGIFYNIIINSTSSIFINLNYQYTNSTSQIGQAVSTHISHGIVLSAGYRFWFQ